MLLGVDQRLAHLHLDWNIQLDTFGIERVVLGVVGRQLKPMRVQVSADKSEVLNGSLELPYAIHTHIGVEAQHSAETVGVLLNGARHHL